MTNKEKILYLFSWWIPADSPASQYEDERKLSFMLESPSDDFDPNIKKIEAAYKMFPEVECGMREWNHRGLEWSNKTHKIVAV